MSKINNFSITSQGVSSKIRDIFIDIASKSVKNGVTKSVVDIGNDPLQFNYRTAKAIWYNSSIKKEFQIAYAKDDELRKNIHHLKSHGVDYYVIEGKVIVCFKKMDKKSRVSGFYSERFQDLMEGNVVNYSSKMLESLSEMGIHKALPIYFIGHILNKYGQLDDIRIVYYKNKKIAYEESLLVNNVNLFSINDANESEIIVTSKKESNLKKVN